MTVIARALLTIFALVTISAPPRAETSEVRITKQPGVLYLPMILMETGRLIEKHAAARNE